MLAKLFTTYTHVKSLYKAETNPKMQLVASHHCPLHYDYSLSDRRP